MLFSFDNKQSFGTRELTSFNQFGQIGALGYKPDPLGLRDGAILSG